MPMCQAGKLASYSIVCAVASYLASYLYEYTYGSVHVYVPS